MLNSNGALHARYIDPEVLQRTLKAMDFTVLFASLFTMLAGSAVVPGTWALSVLMFLALTGTFACLLVLRTAGIYSVTILSHSGSGLMRALATCALAGAGTLGAARLLGLVEGLQWLGIWLMLIALYFGLTRSISGLWVKPLARSGAFRKRIAIVGGGQAAENAISALEGSRDSDVEIVGIFDDRFDDRSPESVNRYRKLGKISELADFARRDRVDLIIVAIPLSAESRLLQMLKRLWELPVDIRICGQSSRLKLSAQSYSYLGKLPLLAVFDRPLSGWNAVLKSAMDRVLAAIFIVLLSPVMIGTAAIIASTSKGPIIFRQKRFGFNNEMVEVFKFRSMYVEGCDATASRLVTKNDPRVTPIGRIIRKTSIDELPQLFNVLTGQLSLVGPRPHATQAKAAEDLYEQVVDGYFARHKVKPGITGWAQINGWRGETDTHEKIENRVKYDLEYIDQWSLLFDLKIILKTPLALLKSENAY